MGVLYFHTVRGSRCPQVFLFHLVVLIGPILLCECDIMTCWVSAAGCGAVSGGPPGGLLVTFDGAHTMVCSLSGVSCNLLAPAFGAVPSRAYPAGHDVVWTLGADGPVYLNKTIQFLISFQWVHSVFNLLYLTVHALFYARFYTYILIFRSDMDLKISEFLAFVSAMWESWII